MGRRAKAKAVPGRSTRYPIRSWATPMLSSGWEGPAHRTSRLARPWAWPTAVPTTALFRNRYRSVRGSGNAALRSWLSRSSPSSENA